LLLEDRGDDDNVVVKSWNSVFTSNKAKSNDCAPLECTVHKTSCTDSVFLRPTAPLFKWQYVQQLLGIDQVFCYKCIYSSVTEDKTAELLVKIKQKPSCNEGLELSEVAQKETKNPILGETNAEGAYYLP